MQTNERFPRPCNRTGRLERAATADAIYRIVRGQPALLGLGIRAPVLHATIANERSAIGLISQGVEMA
jgi:hypothetical protein